MFDGIGQVIAKRPGAVLCVWIGVAVVVITTSQALSHRPAEEPKSFLPPRASVRQGARLLTEAFPQLAADSQIVVVSYRPEGLTRTDFEWLAALAATIRTDDRAKEHGWHVLSPDDSGLHERLVSTDGQVALLVVNLPDFYVTRAAAAAVDHVSELAHRDVPSGLTVELSGTATAGHDLAHASSEALASTKWVTVSCVLVILLLVYRAPLAAVVPIVAIGVCTVIALQILDIYTRTGLPATDLERIFTVVLIYGAGTDFAMFWLSRYREEWAHLDGETNRLAAASATKQVGPAIAVSAGTTILGLLSLATASIIPTNTAGKVLSSLLILPLLAGVTLVPAMVCLIGRAVFWPSRRVSATWSDRPRMWAWLAHHIVKRPAVILGVGLLLLTPAAVRAGFIKFRYDTLSELPPGSSSQRGAAIAHAHFPAGVLYPITLLVRAHSAVNDAELSRLSRAVATTIPELANVEEVFTYANPLGKELPSDGGIADRVQQRLAEPFYFAPKYNTIRFEVIQAQPPFSIAAMDVVTAVRDRLRALVKAPNTGLSGDADVYATGATPYILDVRHYMSQDQWRVWIGATVLIWLAVTALVRRVGLSLFMVGATLLTYATTLGLSHTFFVDVLGQPNLDYKVKLFLFVIIVAVGQDYNIFLVTRLRQETAQHGNVEGTRRAIMRTGGVISSCGIIMAATLGSLCAGGLDLLRQLGFALALGMLVDTFIVRPLLMPSFWMLAARWQGGRTADAPAAALGAPVTNRTGP